MAAPTLHERRGRRTKRLSALAPRLADTKDATTPLWMRPESKLVHTELLGTELEILGMVFRIA